MDVVSAEKKYYGKNYDFVVNERKVLDKKFRDYFLKKYPHTDMSKFYFEHDISKDGTWNKTTTYFKNNDFVSTDINSGTFKNDPKMTQYLYINKSIENFPKIWKTGGNIQELPRGKTHVGYAGKSYYWNNFPVEYVLNYPIIQFRIYVSNTDYFQSNLPGLNITTNDNAKWSLQEPYFQAMVGVWIATYACGISLQHLTPSDTIPKQITSLVRFHLYFTTRRIMRQCQIGDYSTVYKFNAEFLQDHIPKWTWQEILHEKRKFGHQEAIGTDPHKRYQHGPGQLHNTQNDYKKFIPKISDGLTKGGSELLNQSIEAYLYAILGAQARMRQSIVSRRASALETQKVFRQIFEDSVVNYDTSTWINNMNEAISTTNVILNVAISPMLWLIPSSLIILKNPLEGYNNKLKVSDENMVFGINKKLNFYGRDKTKLDTNETKKDTNVTKKDETKLDKKDLLKIKKDWENIEKPKTPHENYIILSLAIVGGVLISKYLF